MSSADRQRRYRVRQRLELQVVPVEVSHDDVEALIRLGVLHREESEAKEMIGAAIKRLLNFPLRVTPPRDG